MISLGSSWPRSRRSSDASEFVATAAMLLSALFTFNRIAEGQEQPAAVPDAASRNPQSRAEFPASEDERPFVYAGTVVDPDGNPVAGAKLHLCYYTREPHPELTPLATTDAEGKFCFSRKRQDFDKLAERGAAWRVAMLVATGDGFGFAIGSSTAFETTGQIIADSPVGWLMRVQSLVSSEKNVLRLFRDAPIKARILDIEGQPVAGARLTIHAVYEDNQGNLVTWEKSLNGHTTLYSALRRLRQTVNGPRAQATAQSTVSDKDGWLVVTGLGQGRIAELQLDGPGIESAQFYARTRQGERIVLPRDFGIPKSNQATFYPAEFTHVAGPSQPVIGQIVEAKSAEPIAGCIVHGSLLPSAADFPTVHPEKVITTADAEGRFRLEGLAPGTAALTVLPPRGSAYLPAGVTVTTGTNAAAVTRDMRLWRGIRMCGRATDGRTGKPVTGSLVYRPHQGNAAAISAGYLQARLEQYYYQTDIDGRFEIPVLPGKGVLAFAAHNWPDYPLGIGNDEIAGSLEDIEITILSRTFNLLTSLDLSEAVTESSVALAVGSGKTVVGCVLTPEGELLTDYYLYGATANSSWTNRGTAEFEVRGYFPKAGRRLMVYHAGRNLVGVYQIAGEPPDRLAITLQPGAVIKGRVIDDDGLPLDNLMIINAAQSAGANPQEANAQAHGILPLVGSGRSLALDNQGRFELQGIVPGLKYSAAVLGPDTASGQRSIFVLGTIFTDVMAEPGETKNLGDIRIARRGAGD